MIKTGKVLNLRNIKADIEDIETFSRYFVVSEIDNTLTAGKNSLSINGSPFLQNGAEIFVEAVDVNGKSLYVELAATGTLFSYREGVSLVYSIHVYENTPSGVGQIIILGTDTLGKIVRWTKTIEINPSISNRSRVRFYKQPTIEVTPLINTTSESTVSLTTISGNFVGSPISPKKSTNVKGFDFLRDSVNYIVNSTDNTGFTSDMVGKRFSFNGTDYIIQEVLTNSSIKLSSPITNSTGVVISASGSYSISYFPFNASSGTENTVKKIGTAEIRFKNLNTFTGNIYRYKIYRSSINAPYELDCVADGVFKGNEILYDSETPYRNNANIGKICSPENLTSHWFVNSPDTSIFHSPEKIIDSFTTNGFNVDNSNKARYLIAKIGASLNGDYIEYNPIQDITHNGSAFDSNFMRMYKNIEYVFSCNAILTKSTNSPASVQFYLKSSMESSKKNKGYDGIGIKIAELTSNESPKYFINYKNSFYLQEDVTGTLMIFPSNGNVTLSNISIKPYDLFSFGPDVSTIRIPFDARAKNEGNIITCELFDINSNLINSNLSTVQYFDPEGITYPYNISVTQQEIDGELQLISDSVNLLSSSFLELSSSFISLSSSIMIDSASFSDRISIIELISGSYGSGSFSASIATTSRLGIVKVGHGLKIDATGSLSIDYDAIVWGGA